MRATVVLALALCLAGFALTQGQPKLSEKSKATCFANEQTIANAVQAAKVETNAPNYSRFYGPARLSLLPDLQTMPICPDGGHYSIRPHAKNDNTTYKIHCSIHGDFDPFAKKK